MTSTYPGEYYNIPRHDQMNLDEHASGMQATWSESSSTTSNSTSTFPTPSAPGHRSLMPASSYHQPEYTPSAMDMSMAPMSYEDDGALYADYMSNTTVRCLSPPIAMAVAQTSETLVTLSAALPPNSLGNRGGCGGSLRTDMVVPGAVPAPFSRTVRELIPDYLRVYWTKVHPVFPIIHKAVFDRTSDAALNQIDLLRCSMAAIATQFLDDKYHRINGHALHSHTLEMLRIVSDMVCFMVFGVSGVNNAVHGRCLWRMDTPNDADDTPERILRTFSWAPTWFSEAFARVCSAISNGRPGFIPDLIMKPPANSFDISSLPKKAHARQHRMGMTCPQHGPLGLTTSPVAVCWLSAFFWMFLLGCTLSSLMRTRQFWIIRAQQPCQYR